MISIMSFVAAATKNNKPRSIRNRLLCILALVPALLLSAQAYAVDAPENIRIEENVLVWDEVDGVTKYDIYLLNFVSLNANGTYFTTVVGATEFTLSTNGIYTVVTVSPEGEYSALEAGGRAIFDSGISESAPVDNNPVSIIVRRSCENAVAGTSCVVLCPRTANYTATGGGCRADTGTVIHQRAQQTAYECIVQNDTSFVESDVYCRL